MEEIISVHSGIVVRFYHSYVIVHQSTEKQRFAEGLFARGWIYYLFAEIGS